MCLGFVLSNLYFPPQGLIDPDAEIKKLEKKLKDTTSQLEGLDKRVKAPQYEEKVPAEVKKSNAERVRRAKHFVILK